MIVLNRDKDLIRVESWQDIENLPGFRNDLNPNDHEIASVIGSYAFRDYIPCGFSNCRTQHARGFIVTTKDGFATNIGKDCGKKYFGIDFETMSQKFNQDILDKGNRERLWSFYFNIEEFKSNINDLRERPFGASWIYHKSRPLVETSKGLPAIVIKQIANMLKTGNNVLSIERKATEEEIQQLEATQGRRVSRPHYVSDPIARIEGYEALSTENDLRQLLVMDLYQTTQDFEKLSIDTLTSKELHRWSKWLSSHEATLSRVEQSMHAGRKLLNRSNLEPFLQLLESTFEIKAMNKYLADLDKAE